MEKILAGLTNKDDVGMLIAKSVIGLTFANDFLCETLGYTKEEVLDFGNVHHLMDPGDLEGNLEASLAVAYGEKSKANLKPHFVRKDGTIFQADFLMKNHKDSSGETLTVMQFENIVDTGETLTENKDSGLANVVAKLKGKNDSGILIGTAGRGVLFTNQQCYAAFGYANKEMTSLRATNFTHSSTMVRLAKNAIKVYSGLLKKAKFLSRFIRKDGKIFSADLTMTRIIEGKAKYLVIQFDNIEHEGENTAEVAS